MDYTSLSGTSHSVNLITKKLTAARKSTRKSKGHLVARDLLSEVFSMSPIYEEVPIKLWKNQTVYLDFFLPRHKIVVEVHGEQHYKFNRFFHKSGKAFVKQQTVDRDKEEWCVVNDLWYVELPHYETVEKWRERLT